MIQKKSVDTILSQLISVDSHTSNDNSRILSLVRGWFKGYDCALQQWENAPKDIRGENLIVKIPGKSSQYTLTFICHLDTVPKSNHWQSDPFTMKEKNGKYYGLGACDTKGGVAALIASVLRLTQKPAFDTLIVFDTDEENFSAGIQHFLKSYSVHAPLFIAIEPTDRKICIAQRSLMHVDIITHGKAQHSSQGTPENNRKMNAIHKMNAILQVLQHDADLLSKETDSLLGTNTQNFGTIRGGTARNVFAENCFLSLDRRLLPTKNPKEELKRLRQLIQNKVPDAIIHGETEPGFTVPKQDFFPQQIHTHMNTYFKNVSFSVFPAWSEAGYTSAYGKSLILGPGSLTGQAHKPDEYIDKQELHHFVTVYRKIIEEIRGEMTDT